MTIKQRQKPIPDWWYPNLCRAVWLAYLACSAKACKLRYHDNNEHHYLLLWVSWRSIAGNFKIHKLSDITQPCSLSDGECTIAHTSEGVCALLLSKVNSAEVHCILRDGYRRRPKHTLLLFQHPVIKISVQWEFVNWEKKRIYGNWEKVLFYIIGRHAWYTSVCFHILWCWFT